MQDRESAGPREREVWSQLDLVTDPELDEALTDLGFVEGVEVGSSGNVSVSFRLPTYWCSPNFAFLMAEDIREAVRALPWVRRIRVRLEDHMCADELNDAVNEKRSFAEAFALRPDGGDLAEVRAKFDGKALQRRQEAVILGLRAAGWDAARLSALTLGELASLTLEDGEAARQLPRYLDILRRLGLATEPGHHAFPDLSGQPLTEAGWSARISALRAVRINMEFGSALCRGLKEHRYKEVTEIDGAPTLVDFMTGRVPPRPAAG